MFNAIVAFPVSERFEKEEMYFIVFSSAGREQMQINCKWSNKRQFSLSVEVLLGL